MLWPIVAWARPTHEPWIISMALIRFWRCRVHMSARGRRSYQIQRVSRGINRSWPCLYRPVASFLFAIVLWPSVDLQRNLLRKLRSALFVLWVSLTDVVAWQRGQQTAHLMVVRQSTQRWASLARAEYHIGVRRRPRESTPLRASGRVSTAHGCHRTGSDELGVFGLKTDRSNVSRICHR